jgi:hypothetical protein
VFWTWWEVLGVSGFGDWKRQGMPCLYGGIGVYYTKNKIKGKKFEKVL